MSLSVLEIVEIIKITLICLENTEMSLYVLELVKILLFV
jgi:hypothetical protein